MPQVVTQLIVDSSGAKMGVAEFEAAMQKAKRSAIDGGEATATAFERAQSRWTQSLGKTDPIIKAQIAMERDLARQRQIGADAVKLGIASQDAANAQLEKVRQQHQAYIGTLGGVKVANDNLAKSTGLARHELINLSRQAQDVVVSLGSGQGLGTVLLQQGSQIADVFASSTATVGSFFGQVGGWAARFATSAAGIATGLVGIGAGALYAVSSWQTGQRDIERALIGIGKQSGATAKDINSIANSSSTTFGLSVDQAREAALEFVKTGAIYKDNIKAATDATYNFSIATGQEAKDAAKQLAQALADPSTGADKLNQQLGFLDGRTRELIITLSNQNRTQEAQKLIIDGVAQSTENATRTLGFFERAWNLVGNAASVAKNAIGSALSGGSDEERLAGLRARRDTLSAGGISAQMRGGVNREQLAQVNAEIQKLEDNLRKAAEAAADDRFKQFSIQADDAIRAIRPEIGQIQALEKALADLKRAEQDANVKGKQGLGGNNAAAIADIEAQIAKTREWRKAVDDLRAAYGGVSAATALQLQSLQLAVNLANARTATDQRSAQFAIDYANAYAQVKNASEATRIAVEQRALREAQVNQALDEQLKSLQNQAAVLRGATELDQVRIKAAQDYQKAVDAGGNSLKAGAVAAQTIANARSASDAREQAQAGQDAARSADRQAAAMQQMAVAAEQIAAAAAEAQRRFDAAANALKFLPFYLTDVMAALRGTDIMAGLFDSKQGGKSQFNPQGYNFNTSSTAAVFANSTYGAGGYDQNTLQPNQQGLTSLVNTYLSGQRSIATANWTAGGGVMGAIEGLLSGTGSTGGVRFGATGLDSGVLQVVQQLTDLLPDDQKAGVIERELSLLRAQPQNIETMQAINQLTESLKQLKQATDANTDALRITTDPLITQGHDYLNNLKIGYYRAASGFDGVARGGIPGVDSIPFHAMVQDGERVTITPRGGSFPSSSSVSNDNSRNVTQHITQNIVIADGPNDRRTGRQKAQGFIAAAARAVA